MKIALVMSCILCCIGITAVSQEIGDFTYQAFLGDNWTWVEDNSYDPAEDVYSVLGSGWDIFGVFDGMTFVYKEISGSFTITAELEWSDQDFPGGPPTAGNQWKKMGLMARADGEDQSSPNIMAAVRNDMGHLLQWRAEHTGDTQFTGFAGKSSTDTNVMQLRRIGSSFSMLRQTSDGSFRVIATQNLDLPTTLHVGLAVTAHDVEAAERGLFRNVRLEPIELGVATTRSFGDSNILLRAGETLQCEVSVFVEEGKTVDLTVIETLPAGWSASNVDAAVGEASVSGNIITWTIPEASGSAIPLTYTAQAGAQAGIQEFSGIVRAGIDEQPLMGDMKAFVTSDQANLGIFDGSMDVSDPNDPTQLGTQGTVVYDDSLNTYTVVGSGWDIFGNSDSFHFLYKEVPIDQPVLLKATIHTDSFTGNGEWSKAGVMLRNDLDSMEANAMGSIRSDQGLFWQWRTGFGGPTDWSGSVMPTGNAEGEQNGTIAISRDPETNHVSLLYYDAVSGEKIETAVLEGIEFSGSFDNPDVMYIGLAVSAHDAGKLTIGSFSNVVLLVGDITDVDYWMIFE